MVLRRYLDSRYKTIFFSIIYLTLMVLAIVSCGGGGGSGDGDGVQTDDDAPLSFSPNPIVASWDEGGSVDIEVTARVNEPFNGDYDYIYAQIIDSNGILEPVKDSWDPRPDTITWNDERDTFTAKLSTNPNLTPGVHTGNFEIRLCEDHGCSSHLPGSPMYLPYEFNVVSSAKLTPLTRWPEVEAWVTFQANAGHTGYVPATLNSTDFSPRWTWKPQDDGLTVVPVVTGEELVYVGTHGSPYDPTTLYALNEFDGSMQWQFDFDEYQINPPAVANDKIFVTTIGSTDSIVRTDMWSFDAYTGAQLSKVHETAYSVRSFAPTPYGNAVYSEDKRGLNCYSAGHGAELWSVNLQMSYDLWTPAVDDRYVYVYVSGALTIIEKDGSIHDSIAVPEYHWSGWSFEIAPVIPEPGKVLTLNGIDSVRHFDSSSNDLIQFDIDSLSIDWSLSGRFVTNPVMANHVIYVANLSPLQLEARSADDGTILWTWSPSDPQVKRFIGNLVVTDNMVLLSTDKKVHAIDIDTKSSVWSHWAPGELALSPNGVLYIVGRGVNKGMLYAVNLK